MDVILAGYNLDIQNIEKLKSNQGELKPTPETISAAYARISRDPRIIPELRKTAIEEVCKSRISNERIIFEMGHSSVAEHVVFNLDVLGVSRYIVEEIEKSRLCSFTEKSQRYILFKDDFVVPKEIEDKESLKEKYINTVSVLNDFYFKLYDKLRPHFFEKHSDLAKDKKNEKMIEGWAKEDARYIIPMATQTQLGMTINARNVEKMITKCASSKTLEAREFSSKLYEATVSITPSVIKYTKPTDYYLKTTDEIKETISSFTKESSKRDSEEAVKLIYNTPSGDSIILASIMHSNTNLDMESCLMEVNKMDNEKKEALFKKCFKYIRSYDAVLREFENASFIFELNISSSCFAQLKRHRMATITTKDYDPLLGVTVPESIIDIGMKSEFLEIVNKANLTYKDLYNENKSIAPYILTNAHRRKVLININVRELYHLARLREDANAQWDIRYVTKDILEKAREKMPLSLLLACGKDTFEDNYKMLFDT